MSILQSTISWQLFTDYVNHFLITLAALYALTTKKLSFSKTIQFKTPKLIEILTAFDKVCYITITILHVLKSLVVLLFDYNLLILSGEF